MTEAGDQVAVTCPGCSPAAETIHEVLAPGGQPTVRCRECDHIHTTTVESAPPERSVRTIVSQDGESITASVEIPVEAILEVGDRFVVDTDDAVYSVELTDIEDYDGRRHERLEADETATLWTRDIGNVSVNVTINPARGSSDDTRSASQQLPGDELVSVGDALRIDGEPVRVTGLLLRDGAVDGAGGRTVDDPGARAAAMDLKRIYTRSQRRVSRDPW